MQVEILKLKLWT